jgi:hypothetical protein
MKAFWTVVILGVGGYAVYKHNQTIQTPPGTPCTAAPSQGAGAAGPQCVAGQLQTRKAAPVTTMQKGRLVRPTCYTGIPKNLPVDRIVVPAGGQPNQCVGYRPTPRGYVSPTGPRANQNGGQTPSELSIPGIRFC